MNVLIIENEALAANRLKKILNDTEPTAAIVDTLDSVQSAVDFFANNPEPDLIFLDIELGDGQSFDILKQHTIQSPVIFTTAYNEYAIKAFRLNSIDYLLKPVNKDALSAALQKFKLQSQRNIVQTLPYNQHYKKRFLAKRGTRLYPICITEVAYFYTKDRIHWLKTNDNNDFMIENNMDELEGMIDPEDFFRVNRQFIIQYNSIDKVHAWFDGKLKLSVKPAASEDIIISRLRAGEFKKWLGK
ncbi:MAG: response regulator transcription factor [Filimonas sp.]|nr:response regulator transcription factor [Filimonas sp.]